MKNISIIITSYNQKHFLSQAIESVLKQTLQPFEIIISDDCSTDGSQKLIMEYSSKYPNLIRPFCHKQNMGIPKNRNFALGKVRGNLVSFLDGDDRYLPEKLERELEVLTNHPEAKLVFSNVYYIDETGKRIGQWTDEETVPPSGDVLKENFSRNWPTGNLYRNELSYLEALRETGFYDENIPIFEDWELKIRFSSKFQVAYCPHVLVEYRKHSEGISKLSKPDFRLMIMKRVYEKNHHLLSFISEDDRSFVEKKMSDKFNQLEAASASGKRQNSPLFKKYFVDPLMKYLRM